MAEPDPRIKENAFQLRQIDFEFLVRPSVNSNSVIFFLGTSLSFGLTVLAKIASKTNVEVWEYYVLAASAALLSVSSLYSVISDTPKRKTKKEIEDFFERQQQHIREQKKKFERLQ